MKKYTLLLMMMILLALSLTGCTDRVTVEESESQTLPPEEKNVPVLAEGETVTIDSVCEFHVDYVTISEDPEYYYKAENGKTNVDFCITYKNLADYAITADNIMEGKLMYSGQYEYGGVDMASEEDGGSLHHGHVVQLEPSDTRQVHYFFTVPREVQDNSRMVELYMTICENEYRVIVRQGEKGTVSVSGDSGASDKTSGDVVDGETVSTEHAQFHVEYAKFTKKVTPPSVGSGYNYFAADDGKVYIDFCIAYTNLSNQKIAANKAVYAQLDQAEARSAVVEQSNRSMFDYINVVNVIPLTTEYIHWIFQVPEEMETNGEQLTISFKVDGKHYTYSVK